MFKNLLKAISVAIPFFLCSIANGQTTDTSYYDLGRIRVKKEFTQSVTIKGEDLERFPATNLSDGISAWISGVYTTSKGIVYVIDGDVINDVNAYSIFDIEEVTLIENATVAVNGITQLQNLVVIKTRSNRAGKSGVIAAGQTNLVNQREIYGIPGANATYYHQYYVSAYKNTDDTHFGISADYQHDATLGVKITSTAVTDLQNKTDRFKFYSYFDTKIGGSSTLNASVNYVPETRNANSNGVVYNSSGYYNENDYTNIKSTLLNTKLGLTSNVLNSLTNSLSLNYNNVSSPESYGVTNQSGNNFNQISNYTHVTDNFLLNDNLQHQQQYGNWSIEPALNFSFRYSKLHNSETVTFGYNGAPSGTGIADVQSEYKIFLLTPSVNIYYKNVFNIQGGFMANLKTTNNDKQLSPFISLSVDALRLTNIEDSYSWKFFGSYANYGNYYDVNGVVSESLNDFYGPTSSIYSVTNPTYFYNSFNNFQAGTVLSLFSKKLSFSYNFEQRQCISEIDAPTMSVNQGNYTIIIVPLYPLVNSTLNRIGISANILNTNKIKWFTNINGTNINYKYDLTKYPAYSASFYDVKSYKKWTGGWINQFGFGKLIFGADILYYTNESIINNIAYANSFVLHNAYIGYSIKTRQFKHLDVYVNARDIAQNDSSDITDNRKFYGLGFKAGF